MSNYFLIKLLKTGFSVNDKWLRAPDSDLLHHKYNKINVLIGQFFQRKNVKDTNLFY